MLRRVRAGGAILFFDEVDALFDKRSEVKDSHDRYANIEINYLLRRMEDYRGLAILCTNWRAALDRAFLRRLRVLVEFPFPDWQQRRARCSSFVLGRTNSLVLRPREPLHLDGREVTGRPLRDRRV
jgi:SpoVK/Ycf46/Vps4 family AAA+-type ATPase